MMAEHIERETAIREVVAARRNRADDDELVRHGHWVMGNADDEDWYGFRVIFCSECREDWCVDEGADVKLLKFYYCPNCGARMDGRR